MSQLVYNAIRTPDGTILESFHRHDYKDYTDKNGKYYAVDGGTMYERRCFDIQDYTDISLYITDDFNEIRTHFRWNSLIGNIRVPVKLCDIKNDHLDALCLYTPASDWCRILFIKEKQLRNELENL